MCSQSIKAILCGIKHDPAGASCSLSYAPNPDDNSKNSGKSHPREGFEFLGAAGAGSLRNALNHPRVLRIITNQHRWKPCK